MKGIVFAALLAAAMAGPRAMAQAGANCITDIRGNQICSVRAGQCMLDRYNIAWCAPGNGTSLKDRYGEVVCGAGACITDRNGEIICAVQDGGFAGADINGKPDCDGGCATASKAACRRATRD